MASKEILNILKEKFDLKENHIKIIESLSEKNNLTADEICKVTKIPKGRIYEFLNELLSIKLILKDKSLPSKYFIKDLDNQIVDFLEYSFNDLMSKEMAVMEVLEEKTKPDQIKLIRTAQEYSFHIMRLFKEGKHFKMIVRNKSAPPNIYPENEEDYVRLRQEIEGKRVTLTGGKGKLNLLLYKSYMSAWKEKQFVYIMGKEGFDFFFKNYDSAFGSKKTVEYMIKLKEDLKERNTKVIVVDEYIPYSIYLSEKEMLLVLTHSGGELAGFVISNKHIIDVYHKLFEEMIKRGKDIAHYIDEYLKKK